ncbi:MAG: pyridoxamine 5'-phosphate oxidase family protein [Rubrivivax sp.]|nr:pyridoxamine 5'-phosphate oxidase family protein [Rubrivivax sp.]
MIDDPQRLRALYPAPGERALRKQMSALDAHALRYIELSPFVVLATSDAAGRQDASPRGGAPGFVRATAQQLWIPDAPGNHRLDSLGNIVDTGRIGLLFLIPGVDETLRVNGRARLSDDAERLAPFAADTRVRLVIEVDVEEAYLHCAKALMRSKLWSDGARVERSVLPTMGQMISDQTGLVTPVESQAQMVARYAKDL